MAQVTMDSKEYIELLDKTRAWDTMTEKLIQGTEVEVSEEYYNGYQIRIPFEMPKKAMLGIAQKVVDVLTQSDEIMHKVVREETTMLDLQSGYLARNWNDNRTYQMDLMTIPKFKAKYEAIVAEAEEEE